jgi:hypothetical protein
VNSIVIRWSVNMLGTRYYLDGSHNNIMLQCESRAVLEATKTFVENVTKTNPARVELVQQIALMEQSLRGLQDCETTEQKHGYLRSVLLNLFDAGDAEMVCGDRVYSKDMIKKEHWSDGKMPGHSRGGNGGFLYRADDDQIVLKQMTWIS